MLKVVLDTVVFVRALINPKSRSGRLLFEFADRYEIVVSKETVRELLEVIHRPELTDKYPALGRVSLRRAIDLASKAQAVEIGERPALSRDPKDDIFIATALASRADYIVSEDKDLLVLKDQVGIPILDTEAFLQVLEHKDWSPAGLTPYSASPLQSR